MTGYDFKKQVKAWAQKIGRREAEQRLIRAKVSIATAQKLAGGRYPSEPGPLLVDAIKRAMDWPNEKAS